MKLPVLSKRWFIPVPPIETLMPNPEPAAGTVAYVLDRADPEVAAMPRILVTALGQSSAETINATCAIMIYDGMYPIVVATDLSTDFLVNAPMPVETLPRAADMWRLSASEYEQYVQRRWSIIMGKWQAIEIIDLAQDLADFLKDQLRQS